jgi:cold shock CspA family protein
LEELQREFKSKINASAVGASSRESSPKTESTKSTAPSSSVSELLPSTFAAGTSARTGTLRKFYAAKGFGFVAVDEKEGAASLHDVFVHVSDINGNDRQGARLLDRLVAGARLRFDYEVDSRTGKQRARRAELLVVGTGGAEEKEVATTAVWSTAASGEEVYSKEELLATFARLQKTSALSSGGMGIRTAPAPRAPRGSANQKENPNLDDEELIQKLEDRLSIESGFDVHNVVTFPGESGWSYEEAVKANAKITEAAAACTDGVTVSVAELFAQQQMQCGFGGGGVLRSDAPDFVMPSVSLRPEAPSFEPTPPADLVTATIAPAEAALKAAAAPPLEGSLRADAPIFVFEPVATSAVIVADDADTETWPSGGADAWNVQGIEDADLLAQEAFAYEAEWWAALRASVPPAPGLGFNDNDDYWQGSNLAKQSNKDSNDAFGSSTGESSPRGASSEDFSSSDEHRVSAAVYGM